VRIGAGVRRSPASRIVTPPSVIAHAGRGHFESTSRRARSPRYVYCRGRGASIECGQRRARSSFCVERGTSSRLGRSPLPHSETSRDNVKPRVFDPFHHGAGNLLGTHHEWISPTVLPLEIIQIPQKQGIAQEVESDSSCSGCAVGLRAPPTPELDISLSTSRLPHRRT